MNSKKKKVQNFTAVSSVTAAILAVVALFSFGGKFTEQLTGYAISNSSPTEPNFLVLFGGLGAFSLIFFIGAVVYKKYSLRLVSDEELEQVGESNATSLGKRCKNKILSWIKKVE
tara:strand:- start:4519 stop:4863 length:345 start_codon:yes stop_codon:yes gene_type:complete